MRNARIVLIAGVVLVSWLLATGSTGQGAPQLINYQGKLTDDVGTPLNGVTVDLTFTFHGDSVGGATYLTVLQELVLVNQGIYNVLLGSGDVTPGAESTLAAVFQNHQEVWLGVAVDQDPEMTPRARISSVPYALAIDRVYIGQVMSEYNGSNDWDGDSYLKVGGTVDCDDWNAAVNPGATELCADGLDNDCDTATDGADSDCGGKPATISKPAVLYSSTSIFNTPIGASPTIDPNSANLLTAFVAQYNDPDGGFMIGVKESGVAVYEVDATTPLHDVPMTIDWANYNLLQDVPIPDYAVPDLNNDRLTTFFNPTTRCEFNFWQFRKVNNGWVAGWGNSTSLDLGGIFVDGGGVRGGGSAHLAGLIWPEELAGGTIDHALVFSYGLTKVGGPIPPFTGSDGFSSDPNALPEGAHLQLDPAFDVNTLTHEFEKTIARALQTYGMYCVDTTSVGIQLYAVNPLSVSVDPYAGVIPPVAWQQDDQGEDMWVSLGIPADQFRVLQMAPENTDPPTDAIPAPGCGTPSGGWREGVWDVEVAGNYAYLAAGTQGLQIVNVTDPDALVLAGGTGGSDYEPAISVAVGGSYAYVGTDYGGLLVVDVSNPANPIVVSNPGPDLPFASVHLEGDTVFAAGESEVYIYDVTNKASPVELGVFADETHLDTARDVHAQGNYFYVTDQWFSLVIVNVSDPSTPTFVSTVWAEFGDSYGEMVFVDGNTAYYTDEDKGLQVVDVSVPATPSVVSEFPLADFAYDVHKLGNYAYVANGAAGLQIIDVSSPATPTRAGELIAIPGYSRDVFVVGDVAYIAAQAGGLVTVNVTNRASPVIHDSIIP